MKLNELFKNAADRKTLYINRPLKNADEFIAWAKNNGFKKTIEPDKLHVTLAFSKEKVDWSKIEPEHGEVECVIDDKYPASTRNIEQLGEQGAVVLRFENETFKKRWTHLLHIGASWEHAGYHPHVTITFDPGKTDYKSIEPYKGPLIFGPEDIQEVDLKWASKVVEK